MLVSLCSKNLMLAALLEEYIPEPGRIHAMQLETGASAFVTLPDKCVCVWGYAHSGNAP